MAEGQGLLTKESIQRTVKSKWFLPALGIGGAAVVLLIMANKRRGSSGSSVDEFVPEQVYSDPGTGSVSSGASESDISGLFAELTESLSAQQEEFQQGVNAQLEGQNAFLEGVAGDLYGQLQSGLQGYGASYGDPYAGMYGSEGYDYSAPIESDYGLTYDEYVTPENQITGGTLTRETRTGVAAQASGNSLERHTTSGKAQDKPATAPSLPSREVRTGSALPSQVASGHSGLGASRGKPATPPPPPPKPAPLPARTVASGTGTTKKKAKK